MRLTIQIIIQLRTLTILSRQTVYANQSLWNNSNSRLSNANARIDGLKAVEIKAQMSQNCYRLDMKC